MLSCAVHAPLRVAVMHWEALGCHAVVHDPRATVMPCSLFAVPQHVVHSAGQILCASRLFFSHVGAHHSVQPRLHRMPHSIGRSGVDTASSPSTLLLLGIVSCTDCSCTVSSTYFTRKCVVLVTRMLCKFRWLAEGSVTNSQAVSSRPRWSVMLVYTTSNVTFSFPELRSFEGYWSAVLVVGGHDCGAVFGRC